MPKPRLALCNGITRADVAFSEDEWTVVELNTSGFDPNVHLRIEEVAKAFPRFMTPRLLDLLEIATYVYTMDCATSRGSGWEGRGLQESWSRHFKFVIAVSDVEFWSQADVNADLRRVLQFLSDDSYEFEFRPRLDAKLEQGYLDFGEHEVWPMQKPERVIMFSGGLDSLAGAIETAATGHDLVLVSHRPSNVLSKRQTQLYAQLTAMYPVRMAQIPVVINKQGGLDREPTQRTRSFLFTALGTLVAESVQAGGVRFFENGIVSLNLPVAQEVIGARASRTTHPLALDLLARLVQRIVEREFSVDNPYLFKTKTDVVRVIEHHGGSALIRLSASCAHQGRESSRTQYHCGTCSQCIDRRVAILAAGLEAHDLETDYKSDVFKGPRKEGYQQSMAVNYAAHVYALAQMGEGELGTRFGHEVARSVQRQPNRSQASIQLIDMHKRHAEAATAVITAQIRKHAADLFLGKLPSSSFLCMIVGQRHSVDSLRQLADRICNHLEHGLPRACASEKPKNEPHLQEICDGILQAQRDELRREFPFMPWSASVTKPDWSSERIGLWVELKYVRQRKDMRQITEDIAADITKYGDNKRRTLFVIYDPGRLVIDEDDLAEPILRHGHFCKVIR